MSDAPADPPERDAVTRGDVARGAGLAGLSRAGALIEALSQPLYVWLFGLATYGLYAAMWSAVNLAENFIDLSLTTALQRIVPTRGDETQAHGAVKIAILVALAPALFAALPAAAFGVPVSSAVPPHPSASHAAANQPTRRRSMVSAVARAMPRRSSAARRNLADTRATRCAGLCRSGHL